MNNNLKDYWVALERLKQRRPMRVPVATKITNDAVAMEAGRQPGSIKKSRANFAELIAAISVAATIQTRQLSPAEKIQKLRSIMQRYRDRLHTSLNRELMLIERISQLENETDKLRDRLKNFENVVPLVQAV